MLRQHGIDTAVVCPGSRNAPIAHNLNVAGLRCVPVTDERSAGFCALGMSQALDKPVVVCVTSGSALLNLAPAVAEACCQHVPLVVVSADRPPSWIGQLDGQTLPQPGALGCFAAKCVTLPEPGNEEERWHCNRLVNEALLAAISPCGCPVHINVPISEPLFEFDVSTLPDGRMIRRMSVSVKSAAALEIFRRLTGASRPMLVAGQHRYSRPLAEALRTISSSVVVLQEPLSPGQGAVHFDEVLSRVSGNSGYMPDFILYAGGTVVSKRLKRFLRSAPRTETWAISADGEVHDTFMSQTVVIDGPDEQILCGIASMLDRPETRLKDTAREFRGRWHAALASAANYAAEYSPRYSQMQAVRLFERLAGQRPDCVVHYANSSAVRLANIYARHYIYVNRGVNGIEGSLSTAAGYSVASGKTTFCVIGDLSFFYDSNALWNQCLRGNFRVLLLNNRCGGIFRQLPGLDDSPACARYVAASHNTDAEGLCRTYGVEYLSARNEEELKKNMRTFLDSETRRPLVFEVLTAPEEDSCAIKEYYEGLSTLLS